MKNQGMVIAADGRRMSKRWGNVVNPDDIVKTYGADTLRIYEMFMGPFDQMIPWSTESIIGSRRFLEKVWRIGQAVLESKSKKTNPEAEIILNKTIKKVTEDIESFSFNTAISSMMILVNVLEKTDNIKVSDFLKFLQILCPFAPHITEELASLLGQKKSLIRNSWPAWDEDKIEDEKIKVAVQVNGKVRSEIEIAKEAKEEDVRKIVMEDSNVKKWLENKDIKRFIYVPGRVINIVV
jgi:leucyl-tRNA synthetase